MMESRAVFDATQLETLRSLQEPGGPDVVGIVLDEFRQEATSMLREMRQAFARGDARSYNRVAHALKSSSTYVGACELSAICAAAEARSLDGLPADALDWLERVEGAYAAFATALHTALKTASHTASHTALPFEMH